MPDGMQNFKLRVQDFEEAQYDGTVKTYYVDIDVSESLMPDDEWRSIFYDFYTLEQVAEHIAWNIVIRKWSDDQVEGFADKQSGVDWIINSHNWAWEQYYAV